MSILSIDVGSSRCKAALINACGEILALRTRGYTPRHPRPGYAELDPKILFEVVSSLCREVSQGASEAVQAVCFSSHGETFVPMGHDGHALRPAILNSDMRATAEAAACEQRCGRERLFSITGHVSHPMYPLPKLLWLREHEPEVFAAAGRFAGVTDYMLLRLGLEPLMDYSHAARFMALDVSTRAWSDEMLEAACIPRNKLSTPVQAGTIAGCLSAAAAGALGAPEGTPVIVGGHDQVVGALGMGVIGAARAAGSLGTWECILVASDQPQLNPAALAASLNSYPHAVPGQYVTIAYFPAGIMLAWLHELLYGAGADEEEHWRSLEQQAPAGPSGLLITPHLIGSCNPEFDSAATAAIGGLTTAVTRVDLFKGVLEGIASELAVITECLASANAAFDDINVSGGGTRSRLGIQLRAALTGKQLHIMQSEESVCLGGAMLAAVALGHYPDLGAAARGMVHEKECIGPEATLAEVYRPQFARYRSFRSGLVHPHPTGEQS